MASVSSFLFLRHLRGEPTSFLLFFKDGVLEKSGRGLCFWFLPLGASIAEVPLDDRELPFLFHGRSSDFQDVTVQGVATYRVTEPRTLAERVDFTIDTQKGTFTKQPLDRLAMLMTQLAQQLAMSEIGRSTLRSTLDEGIDRLREVIHQGLVEDRGLVGLGIEIVSTRIASVKPTAEMERALQMPTREAIQQEADQATFARRALAVEKERAIQENELGNQIELARREEQLIAQRGQNESRRATEAAAARRIEGDSKALATRTDAEAEAEGIRMLEGARVVAERDRIAIYRDLPSGALLGLAARELAGNLPAIEHLSLGPELFGPLLTRLVHAGTERLEARPVEAT